MLWNDQSVLEQLHVTTLFAVLSLPMCNVFGGEHLSSWRGCVGVVVWVRACVWCGCIKQAVLTFQPPILQVSPKMTAPC